MTPAEEEKIKSNKKRIKSGFDSKTLAAVFPIHNSHDELSKDFKEEALAATDFPYIIEALKKEIRVLLI
jgi:hypothetical protein